jgi:TPR repeat protein
MKWLSRAAEGGDIQAQYRLGLVYSSGDGAPRDAEKAHVWLRKAAEKGFGPALNALRSLERATQPGETGRKKAVP